MIVLLTINNGDDNVICCKTTSEQQQQQQSLVSLSLSVYVWYGMVLMRGDDECEMGGCISQGCGGTGGGVGC